jgi:fatty-acyl-CoA synthase
MTAVGKIFKPELRIDASQRLVTKLVNAEIGQNNADIAVTTGTTRLCVTITLTGVSNTERVEALLVGHSFDYSVNAA